MLQIPHRVRGDSLAAADVEFGNGGSHAESCTWCPPDKSSRAETSHARPTHTGEWLGETGDQSDDLANKGIRVSRGR